MAVSLPKVDDPSNREDAMREPSVDEEAPRFLCPSGL